MWLSEFRSAFTESTLDLLWRHWTAFGVLGGQREAGPGWLLDPEALVLGTVRFGRYDPRLFDAMLDWLTANSDWVSSTRLKRMQKTARAEERAVLTSIAGVLSKEVGTAKWEGLVGDLPRGGSSKFPLFLREDGTPLPQGRRQDDAFGALGFSRPPRVGRASATLVSAGKEALLRVRLRALFGVTSRSEILLFLLTHPRAYPSLVARHAYYAQPPVAKVMAELATSGLVAERRLGRERLYGLDLPAWRSFLSLSGLPRWADWALVFRALGLIRDTVDELLGRPASAAVVGGELSRVMRQATTLFGSAEVELAVLSAPAGAPERYPALFLQNVEALFRRLGGGFERRTLLRSLRADARAG